MLSFFPFSSLKITCLIVICNAQKDHCKDAQYHHKQYPDCCCETKVIGSKCLGIHICWQGLGCIGRSSVGNDHHQIKGIKDPDSSKKDCGNNGWFYVRLCDLELFPYCPATIYISRLINVSRYGLQ